MSTQDRPDPPIPRRAPLSPRASPGTRRPVFTARRLSGSGTVPTVVGMQRIGLTGDHLAANWDAVPRRRYAARVPGLSVLEGEILALVGKGSRDLLDRLARQLDRCARVDGGVAARGGVLRVHAQQAARVGVRALAVDGALDEVLPGPARQLAIADLAGLGNLGLTVVVELADPALAALFADRVVVVAGGEPRAAYPILAAAPREPAAVRPVTERIVARLAGQRGCDVRTPPSVTTRVASSG